MYSFKFVNSLTAVKGFGLNMIVRNFNLQEHYSLKFLQQAGVPVPNFVVVKKKSETKAKAASLNTPDMVVKAQVLTGGRGKGTFKGGLKGGVQMVKTPEEAEKIAGQMIGDYLVTAQTGQKGILCNYVMIAEMKKIAKEYYLAILLDRQFGGPVIIYSKWGGMDIEQLNKTSPESINYSPVDVVEGLGKKQGEDIASKLGLKNQKERVADILMKLYDIFIKKDATLLEINPLAEDNKGDVWCVDAKISFDESAEFRQKTLHSLRDFSQEDIRDTEASSHGLNFVAMQGTIGCLVNGAGLAMATMDILHYHGGTPANFLDVGGGAQVNQVKIAFQIITSDPSVMTIFVNIFGGIMRCDIIAEGIIIAIKELNLKLPLVCRLQGTNQDEARLLIASSGVKILPVHDLDEAARLAVKLSQIMNVATTAKVNVIFELPL